MRQKSGKTRTAGTPLSVPLRKAEDPSRGLDSLGSDRGKRKQGRHSRHCTRSMPVLNLTQYLTQACQVLCIKWKRRPDEDESLPSSQNGAEVQRTGLSDAKATFILPTEPLGFLGLRSHGQEIPLPPHSSLPLSLRTIMVIVNQPPCTEHRVLHTSSLIMVRLDDLHLTSEEVELREVNGLPRPHSGVHARGQVKVPLQACLVALPTLRPAPILRILYSWTAL